MINILCSYLKGLNDEYIKYISNTIMNNFILYKQKMITKKMHNIFIIYAKQELLSIKEQLIKWENNTLYADISKNNSNIVYDNPRDNYFHLNLNVGPIMNNSPGVPIIINNNNTNSNINNSNVNIENEYKKYNNNYNRNINKNNNIYSTLYNSSSNYSSIQKGKHNHRSYSSEASQRKKNYIPIGNKNEKNLIYKKLNKNNCSSEKILNKFIKRQENYIKTNSQKKQKIIKDNEEEIKLIYTFEPKVNESLRKLYKKDKISASNRLYNDGLERKKKILEQEKNYNNNSKIIYGKNFNLNKYIELYEESKMKKDKQEELIRKIEKECGYTYAPKVMHKKIDFRNNNNIYVNEKKVNRKKFGKNKSFCQGNKENKNKNSKKIEKNNTCKKISKLKKKDNKKNINVDNNNVNKINGLLK